MTLIPLGQTRSCNTLGVAPSQQPDLFDGAMSGEDFLRKAAIYHKEQAARLRKYRGPRQRPERASPKDSPVTKAIRHGFQAAGQVEVIDGATGKMQAEQKATSFISVFGCDVVDLEADIVITNVHAIPQRQRSIVPPGMAAHECVSAPMQKQMDTGRWPTLREHLEGISPAYTFSYDPWGHLEFSRYSGGKDASQQ